jgi:hypothetical protein
LIYKLLWPQNGSSLLHCSPAASPRILQFDRVIYWNNKNISLPIFQAGSYIWRKKKFGNSRHSRVAPSGNGPLLLLWLIYSHAFL